ncbi:MAG: hypothetical protein KKF12_22710 [Proteobacteria bacterium]|nr:hypothetical protein [Desulfobacula sp.]MBU3952442.1 hypothetical protein [Pseudomonadota bacterium]MBU4133640.1 hypothetical protein [Pseudomonadota bacterium]
MMMMVPFCALGIDDFLLGLKALEFIQDTFCKIHRLSCVNEVKILADRHFVNVFRSLNTYDFKIEEIEFSNPFDRALPENIFKNSVLLNGLDENGELFVVSPRNPLVSEKILTAAVAKYTQMKDVMLISVIASSDHPCQLFSLNPSETGDVYIDGLKGRFLQSPFPGNPDLWIAGDDNTPAVNQVTKKQIKGRQDFPDVYEPDGSFLIAKTDVLKKASQSSILPDYQGFTLGADASINICRHLDYYQYLAVQKSRQEKQGVIRNINE